jgi:hypothetical protein
MSVDDYPAAHTPAGPETRDLDALLTALDRLTTFVGESTGIRPRGAFLELLALDQEVSSLCQVTGIALPPITYEGTYGDDFVGFSRLPVTRTTAGCLIWVDPGWRLAMQGLRRTVELMRDRRRTQAGARQVEGTGARGGAGQGEGAGGIAPSAALSDDPIRKLKDRAAQEARQQEAERQRQELIWEVERELASLRYYGERAENAGSNRGLAEQIARFLAAVRAAGLGDRFEALQPNDQPAWTAALDIYRRCAVGDIDAANVKLDEASAIGPSMARSGITDALMREIPDAILSSAENTGEASSRRGGQDAGRNSLPLCPQWLDNPGNFRSIPPPPPSVQTIQDADLRQRAIDAWLCACRLRTIIDVWRDWFRKLRTKGDADPGAAFRLSETASSCVRALWDCGAKISTLRRNDLKGIASRLPDLPVLDVEEWQDNQQFIDSGLARLGELYPFQGELNTFMTLLATSPSMAFSAPPAEQSEGADDGGDQGGGGRPEGADANGEQAAQQPEALSPLQYDILDALRILGALDPEKRATGRDIAAKVGGDATEQSAKAPLADLKRKGLVDSKTGRNGGSWLTTPGLNLINSLRPKQ